MTEIKICGITNEEDALFAASCGIEALGFIFHPPSPRYVTPEKARRIISALPPEVAKVGVFVNLEARLVEELRAFCGLDFLQLHGDESPEYCRHFSPSVLLKALSLEKTEDIAALTSYRVRAILVDARDAERYGGTGKKANWKLAKEAKKITPLILSGGLQEGNIGSAIREVAPQAVDINSGAESAPGKKDREKVKNIIALIRSYGTVAGEKKIFIHN